MLMIKPREARFAVNSGSTSLGNSYKPRSPLMEVRRILSAFRKYFVLVGIHKSSMNEFSWNCWYCIPTHFHYQPENFAHLLATRKANEYTNI